MDIDFEIQKLKHKLINDGLEPDEVEEICDEASIEISDFIVDAVANALNEAEELGSSMNAKQFLSELKAINVGGTFQITTDTGKTDYSEPEKQMLPNLLKRGKTSKDGSIYKRIPIPKNKMPVSSYQLSVDMSKEQELKKQSLRDEIKGTIGLRKITKAADAYVDSYASTRSKKKEQRQSIRSADVEIRTASSKQDPATRWVIPPKEMDLTSGLTDINSRLRNNIENTVIDIIRRYEVY